MTLPITGFSGIRRGFALIIFLTLVSCVTRERGDGVDDGSPIGISDSGAKDAGTKDAGTVCHRATCGDLGKTCGTWPDGCDGTVTCGAACVSECTLGAKCSTGVECRVGSVTCSGTASCIDIGAAAEGTGCTGGTCRNGKCVVCSAGDLCDTGTACRAGIITCDTGFPICHDIGPLGGSCTNGTCVNGACVPCRGGASCDRGVPCRAGIFGCVTGAPVCVDDGPQVGVCPNGICVEGVCAPCQEGASCTPLSPGPCHTGTMVCTGTPTCQPKTVAAGTACGAELFCSGADCLPCATTVCSGLCTDTQTDSKNCGQCGAACDTGWSCQAGSCR